MEKRILAKINVLVLLPASYGGGAERLVLDQIKYSTANLHVLTLRPENSEQLFKQKAKERKTQYTSLCVSKLEIPLTAYKLLKYIKKHNIQIIHTHLIEADLYGYIVSRLCNVTWVTTKHNTDEFRKKKRFGYTDGFISRRASCIIAVSKSVRDFLDRYEHIPIKSVTIQLNGIDAQRFKNITPFTRKKFGFKKTDFVIGIVGRVDVQKGHVYLIEAVKKYIEKNKLSNIRLVIFGKGPLEDELKSKYGHLPYISFFGYQSEIERTYSLFDAFALPSLFEGFGLVLLEAMAAGVPVITTKIDGIKEFANNKNAILCRPANVDDLVAAIHAIKSKKHTLSQSEMKKTVAKYSMKKNIQTLEELYVLCLKQ